MIKQEWKEKGYIDEPVPEGIDLKGDSLSGEIIVGTGFPPPSPEAEAESEAYYKREKK